MSVRAGTGLAILLLLGAGVARAQSGLTELADPSPDVRQRAILLLGQERRGEAAEALIRALLTDEDDIVRARAAWALGRLQAQQAHSALNRTLRLDPHEEVRARCAWALSQLGQDRDAAVLAAASADKSQPFKVRKAAMEGLASVGGPRAQAALKSISADDDDDMSLKSLADLLSRRVVVAPQPQPQPVAQTVQPPAKPAQAQPPAKPELQSQLRALEEASTREERRLALLRLGETQSDKALEPLGQALGGKFSTRLAAIEGLGATGQRGAAKFVMDALAVSDDAEERVVALEALGELKAREGAKQAFHALSDEDLAVQVAAFNTLRGMGFGLDEIRGQGPTPDIPGRRSLAAAVVLGLLPVNGAGLIYAGNYFSGIVLLTLQGSSFLPAALYDGTNDDTILLLFTVALPVNILTYLVDAIWAPVAVVKRNRKVDVMERLWVAPQVSPDGKAGTMRLGFNF